jgi:acetolactate synthase I/II/III large subunit
MKSTKSISTAENISKQSPLQPVFRKNAEDEAQLFSGSEILLKTLTDLGVDTIFGYPGGAVLPIYDTLFGNTDLRHFLIRHEQAGTHAADGYSRATGKPGVVLATSGPGGTNTVTGIATAMMDSIPLVVLTGQVPTSVIGNDAFQEADIVGITRPITKQNYLVRDVNNLEHVLKEAFHIATHGRPGPVLVDLPKDMLNTKGKYAGLDNNVDIPSFKPTLYGHHPQIAKAAEMLSNAKKPLIYVGGGAILGQAWEEVTAMAERLNIPVTTTLMGLGAFPESKSQSLGMLGMHGTWFANMAMTECDVLIAVGARFDDRVTGRLDGFSQNSRKIHIDIDPSCIGKNVEVEVPIVGDVKHVIPAINKLASPPQIDDWWATIRKWQKEHPLVVPKADDKIYPQHMVKMISEVTCGNAIVVTDVGQHQMWAAQHYQFNYPRSWISSGGLGTMGYGFPAAMGAALACPDRDVFCITGDGGFQMSSYELATAVEYKIPVKIALMNNNCLGMVRQWQQLFFNKRYSYSVFGSNNPDFVKMAESYGCVGLRAENPEELKEVLEKAMAIKDAPVLMDIRVVEEENCYPMVPSGAALFEMVESDEEAGK